jgi:hypothetical protein
MVKLNTEFYYLDIGIKSWDVRKRLSRIFLDTFYKDFSPISRYPDEMIFRFIEGMGTFTISHTLSYQILTRPDSHFITRREFGVLCGSIMDFMQKLASFLLLLFSCSCATLPTGPSVTVLPAPGKSFDTFRTEDATCRHWAEQHLGASPQQTYESNVATGAAEGTAIGAGLGAALGSTSGNAGAGALIGGLYGLLVGTSAGSDTGQVYGREAQRRYDNAYVQCMYAYGNQVPGFRPYVAAAPSWSVVASPPPPPVMPQGTVPPYDVPPSPSDAYQEPGQYTSPPDVDVDEALQFIYSPALNMYVAVGVPYDLVYTGSDYFYFYGGLWYRGPYYNGPWVLADSRSFPQVLLRYRVDQIRFYRDEEFRRYNRDREHYDGRIYHPEYHGDKRNLEHKEEHK